MKTSEITAIEIRPAMTSRRREVDFGNLEFGKVATDHMFMADYFGSVWHDARIVPSGAMEISPMISALHYGQTVFEGLKGYRLADGRISVFRPRSHAQRFNRSLDRMCMPAVPEDLFVEALEALVGIDSCWVPTGEGTSLYIRPFMFATDERLGVKVSDRYRFMIVCSPVGAYYSKPIRVKVELRYARAFRGGAGYTKCGGNYGMSFYPYKLALSEGFDQVIWTDAETHEFVEESGTMNLGFIRGNTLLTPPSGETILAGITRDSLLKIAPKEGLKVEERLISYRGITEAIERGEQVEAFGIGTAATIAPIREIGVEGKVYSTYHQPDAVMFRLKKALEEIRTGVRPDVWGWNHVIAGRG